MFERCEIIFCNLIVIKEGVIPLFFVYIQRFFYGNNL